MTFRLVSGDCLDALAEMPEASVDAVVTDPPYGISFMGKEWDGPAGMLGQMATGKEQRGAFAYGGTHSRGYADNDNRAFQVWTEAWATELLRVLKPGGHLLAFGGTRTYHRLASGIEDAGFEIRDCLAWHYGSGFPKSLDVSKAMDKAAGAEREVVGMSKGVAVEDNKGYGGIARGAQGIKQVAANIPVTAPATPAAQKWQGWGTALKPAFEPIILARKPLIGTVAENVTRYGTGALNVDGCRVGTEDTTRHNAGGYGSAFMDDDWQPPDQVTTGGNSGRWPANLVLDDQAAAMLDEQSGEIRGQVGMSKTEGGHRFITGDTETVQQFDYGTTDTGGASRFFYQAKASRAERNAGLDDPLPNERFRTRRCTACQKNVPEAGACGCDADIEWVEPQPTRNPHPTVKPIDLMRWLVRLVTPPGGTVLDPFTGSGTTGIAAGLEGFDFVGIEREAEYREIAEARLKWWAEQEGETAEILRRAGLAEKERERAQAVGQVSLFDEAA